MVNFHQNCYLFAEVECAEPKIDNAEWSSGSRPPHKFMAEVIYDCNAGYKMEGERRLTCNINSQWSPGIPHCKSKSRVLLDYTIFITCFLC